MIESKFVVSIYTCYGLEFEAAENIFLQKISKKASALVLQRLHTPKKLQR